MALVVSLLLATAPCEEAPARYVALFRQVRALTFPQGQRADGEAADEALFRAIPLVVSNKAAFAELAMHKRRGDELLRSLVREHAGAYKVAELAERAKQNLTAELEHIAALSDALTPALVRAFAEAGPDKRDGGPWTIEKIMGVDTRGQRELRALLFEYESNTDARPFSPRLSWLGTGAASDFPDCQSMFAALSVAGGYYSFELEALLGNGPFPRSLRILEKVSAIDQIWRKVLCFNPFMPEATLEYDAQSRVIRAVSHARGGCFSFLRINLPDAGFANVDRKTPLPEDWARLGHQLAGD